VKAWYSGKTFRFGLSTGRGFKATLCWITRVSPRENAPAYHAGMAVCADWCADCSSNCFTLVSSNKLELGPKDSHQFNEHRPPLLVVIAFSQSESHKHSRRLSILKIVGRTLKAIVLSHDNGTCLSYACKGDCLSVLLRQPWQSSLKA